MKQMFVVALTLVHLCLSGRIKREIGDPCTTPNSESGACANIRNCPELLEHVKRNATLLREYHCGFVGLDPVVCCPELSSKQSVGDNLISGPKNTSKASETAVLTSTTTEASNVMSTSKTTCQCGRVPVTVDKIVGGSDSDLGAWPWMAAVGYKSRSRTTIQWLCGGTLVTKQHVITAAHCILIPTGKTLSVVRLGDLNLDDSVADGASPLDVEVEKTLPHSEYSPNKKINDIGIITLKNAVQYDDYIHPICLPSPSKFTPSSIVGKNLVAIGWGTDSFGGRRSNALQQVSLEVTDEESCKSAYQNLTSAIIDERVLCTRTSGRSACQGDSGGPLMLLQNDTFYLMSLVSYGKDCADPSFPGVSTRITSFMDWILRNIT